MVSVFRSSEDKKEIDNDDDDKQIINNFENHENVNFKILSFLIYFFVFIC